MGEIHENQQDFLFFFFHKMSLYSTLFLSWKETFILLTQSSVRGVERASLFVKQLLTAWLLFSSEKYKFATLNFIFETIKERKMTKTDLFSISIPNNVQRDLSHKQRTDFFYKSLKFKHSPKLFISEISVSLDYFRVGCHRRLKVIWSSYICSIPFKILVFCY